jgi:hypothetical protein
MTRLVAGLVIFGKFVGDRRSAGSWFCGGQIVSNVVDLCLRFDLDKSVGAVIWCWFPLLLPSDAHFSHCFVNDMARPHLVLLWDAVLCGFS